MAGSVVATAFDVHNSSDTKCGDLHCCFGRLCDIRVLAWCSPTLEVYGRPGWWARPKGHLGKHCWFYYTPPSGPTSGKGCITYITRRYYHISFGWRASSSKFWWSTKRIVNTCKYHVFWTRDISSIESSNHVQAKPSKKSESGSLFSTWCKQNGTVWAGILMLTVKHWKYTKHD